MPSDINFAIYGSIMLMLPHAKNVLGLFRSNIKWKARLFLILLGFSWKQLFSDLLMLRFLLAKILVFLIQCVRIHRDLTASVDFGSGLLYITDRAILRTLLNISDGAFCKNSKCKPLFIFTKSSNVEIWQSSECAFEEFLRKFTC